MEKKVQLFSGGFDSRLQEWLIKPDVLLYIDMGTSYSERELEELQRLPNHYKDRLVIRRFSLGEFERENKYLPYRNLILGTLAMQFGQHVYFGFNAKDDAPDKDKEFLQLTTDLFRHLNINAVADMGWDNRKFSFKAPFQKFTKTQMVRKCLNAGMPAEWIQNIRSCYDGVSEKGCGVCDVCLAKAIALINNGIFEQNLFDNLISVETLQDYLIRHQESFYDYDGKDVETAIRRLTRVR